MCRYVQPRGASAVFGHPTHDLTEADNWTGFGPANVDHRSEGFFDLSSRGRIQDEEDSMSRSIHIRFYQLDI